MPRPLGVFASIGARLGASLKTVQAMVASTVHSCAPPVDQQARDIKKAVDLLSSLKKKLLAG